MIGTTLAHYRITAALGRGGMGEVYRATDSKLGRAIAILAPFAVGEPVTLFKLEIPALAISGNRNYYAPSRDGHRFLVNTLLTRESEPGLRMVLGWSPPGGEKR